jgi:ADP-heptose:LPS heptosyltransferase
LKTKRKIIIDNILGTPLVYLVNITARLLGRILRIDHSLDKPFKTIVIAKYVGLGSIIQSTPMIQTLRKKFPQARIVFITTTGGEVLLKHIPEVNEILTVSDKNLWQVFKTSVKLVFSLWRLKPELFIDLEFYSNYSSIITTVSKSRNRLGFLKADKMHRKGMYNYLLPFNIEDPISETYLKFARLVKCDTIVTALKLEVKNIHWESISQKTGLLRSQKYIIINPNASDLRIERRWPKQHFVNVINSLHVSNEYKLVLIGDKTETAYVQEMMDEIRHPELILNTAGRLNLYELIDLIAGATLMLTNDTGPMHIALASGVKTISLFGPCSPRQYGDINGITFYKKVHCSPCVHKYIIPPCRGDNQCMKKITEKEVLEAIEASLPA